MTYEDFLAKKQITEVSAGFDPGDGLIPNGLFDFQKAIVKWALRRGRAAVFADTGLGKSFIQAAWAEAVSQYNGSRVLIVAPLCVAPQTVEEASKLDMQPIKYVREMDWKSTGIFITNYEMIDNFQEAIEKGWFDGIVLDESSILKHTSSKTRAKIFELASHIPYRLSCTATPSPNDYMELGSQAEFLGIMGYSEMLAMFFTHDSGETSKWRLKGHGKSKFWEWFAQWAVYIKKPSDIGFSDDGYNLPDLRMHEVKVGYSDGEDYKSLGLVDRHRVKKESIEERVAKCAEIINSRDGQSLIWCHRNDESSLLKSLIPDSVEVKGSDSIQVKEERLDGFKKGKYKHLITKPSIAGFGLNWQHCSRMAFVGLTDSYEQIYQAIRRCWRFGQTKDVDVFFICHALEGPVLKNIQEKERRAEEMANALVSHMRDFQKRNVIESSRQSGEYETSVVKADNWTLYSADCVEVAKGLEDESIDYSVFSPPFASLYTYSNSPRDMGNSRNYEEFWVHYDFLVKELFRVTRTGRLVSVHCMNLKTTKTRDGKIEILDFRGDMIRMFKRHGFLFHSEVSIWKDPVVQMQRTKALGLLWKQIQKDSSRCHQGLADYVLTFRKDGENSKPISHTKEQFPVDKWQHYASPCWFDIRQSNTLNGRSARVEEDERHIAPLQLDLIGRLLDLWSAPGDLVYSPFAGIGSEGVVSLEMGRRFVGSELKKSYFDLACRYLGETKFGINPILDLDTDQAKQTLNSLKNTAAVKPSEPDVAQTTLDL